MKVSYADNPALPTGNGFLKLSGELFADGPWTISIQRSSDQKYLGGKQAEQWLGETVQMPIADAEIKDGSLNVSIGPAIVDSLDQKDQYRVTLTGSDGKPHSGRLRIGSISHSMGKAQGKTARMAEKVSPKPEKPQEAPASLGSREPLSMKPETGGEMRPKKRSPWLVPIIVLLCLICVVWWYFTPKKENQAETGAKEEGKPAVTAQKASGAGALTDVERSVREFFAGSNLAPLNAVELARSLPANTPAEKDAIYRLYYYAATSANPEGLLEYGNCLDPSTPEWGTIEKNGVEAWQVYRKAEKNDKQKADAALEKLRRWLEEQSAAGNAKARAWLGGINK